MTQERCWQTRLGPAVVSDFGPKPKLFQAHGVSEMMSLRGRGRGISPAPRCISGWASCSVGRNQDSPQEPGLPASMSSAVEAQGTVTDKEEKLHVSAMVFSR